MNALRYDTILLQIGAADINIKIDVNSDSFLYAIQLFSIPHGMLLFLNIMPVDVIKMRLVLTSMKQI